MQAVRWTSPAVAIVCVLSSLSFSATPDRITGAMSNSQTVELRGAVHKKAQPQFDKGPADPGLQFGSMMLLTLPTVAQRRALAQLVLDQQNPKSRNYHKWLTPEQWADRFGLSQNDIQRLRDWLQGQGFQINYVARGRNWISFSGSAAQIQSAFGTEIHQYLVNGEMHVANATAPKIPATLAGVVSGIRGMDDFHWKPRVKKSMRPDYFSSSLGAQVLAPGDIATMYDINALYNGSPAVDGTGQKLAIVGQTDVYLSDINNFRSGFGLSTLSCTTNGSGVITACSDSHFKYVVPTGVSDPGTPASGDLLEADLDLEWSGAIARNAQIVFVNAPVSGNSGGVIAALYFAIDNSEAPVISMSYGNCEFNDNNVTDPTTGLAGPDEVELQKANTNGMTVVNSSGDNGAAECDPNTNPGTPDAHGASATGGVAVSYPASSPEVTGVGGTGFSIATLQGSGWNTSNNPAGGSIQGYLTEQPWNDDEVFGNFCSANSSNTFCKQGGTPAVTGWVAMTNAKTAQQDLALVTGDGISSTGGGVSNCAKQTTDFSTCVSGFPQPSWQTVTVPGHTAMRFSPDVSLLASPSFPGYIVCTQVGELGDSGSGSSCASGIPGDLNLNNPGLVGGTSAAAPIFAAILTLVAESLPASAIPLGNVNPTLYKLASKPSNGAFHQIGAGTSSTNQAYCTSGTPGSPQPAALDCTSSGVLGFSVSSADTTTGYNLVTGLGSVDVAKLATAWSATIVSFNLSSTAASPASFMAGNSATTTVTVTPVSGSGFTGSVTFNCPGAPSGIVCTGSPVTGGSGSQQVTIAVAPNVAAGTYGIPIVGTSGSMSNTTTVSITVTATNQSFTMTTDAQTYTVAQGSGATVKVSWTATNGFNLPLTFSCSDTASESTCIGPSGQQNQSPISFAITTTAATASSRRPGSRIFYAALLPGLLGIVFVAGSRKRSLRGMRMLGMMLVLASSTMWLGSCGGSSNNSTSNPGTPKQSYTFTISATTGGSGPITGNSPLQFTLTVQ